jgi:endonuclease/exonuclease/phosphatase family metal-dependent hydrolase
VRILFAALVIFIAGCQSAPKPAHPTFRVMTYNIHHGEGLDGKVDLLRIAEVIKRERADIVALQEVDKGVERTARRDLASELAELTGMACVFSNNIHFQGGEYGNAVLTRFPIVRWTNTHYQVLRSGEQRGILQLLLSVQGTDLVFMNTHLDHRPDDSERLLSADKIKDFTQGYGSRPIILCGDFNSTPESTTHAKLTEKFDDAWELVGQGHGFTFSADRPKKRIDYLWLSKDRSIAPIKLWVPQTDASDHLPLVGEFHFR